MERSISVTIAKRQHYVYQAYLNAWEVEENRNQVWCLQNKNQLFISNTENLGVVQYYNKFPGLADDDIKVVKFIEAAMTHDSKDEEYIRLIKVTVNFYIDRNSFINKVNYSKKFHNWFKNTIGTNGEFEESTKTSNKFAEDYINHGLEGRYSHAENCGIEGLRKLQNGDLSFWDDKEKRSSFCYFLWNQYFRTRKIRDGLSKGLTHRMMELETSGLINSVKNLNMDGLAQIVSDMMETRMVCSDTIFLKKAVLLKNETVVPFITCDQPIVNLLADYETSNFVVEDFYVYYPISPRWALIIIDDDKFAVDSIPSEKQIMEYNDFIFKSSNEQIYSNSKEILQAYKAV